MPSGESLWELIETRVDATPDAMMTVDGDMRITTFAEFWHEAELAAAGLVSSGVGADDIVTWQLPTGIESMVLAAALSRIGAVQCPLLPHLTLDEAVAMTTAVGSNLLVLPGSRDGDDVSAVVTRAAEDDTGMRILVLGGALPQGDVKSLPPVPDPWVDGAAADEPERRAEWIFHSTGGGTRARRVRHDDRSLSTAATGMARRLGLIQRDRHALVAPIASVDGILWLFAGLSSGCANILVDGRDTTEAIDVLSREGVTLVGSADGFHEACVEAQLQSLHPLFPDARAFVGQGGEGSAEVHQRVIDLFGVPVLSYYGTVEAPMVSIADLSDPDDKIRTTRGRVQHTVEVRVTDERGRTVAPGVEGELRVRGAHLMLGYCDPTHDGEVFDDDGLFRTGDLGTVDPDGYVTVTGRTERVVLDPGVVDGDEVVVDVSDGASRLH